MVLVVRPSSTLSLQRPPLLLSYCALTGSPCAPPPPPNLAPCSKLAAEGRSAPDVVAAQQARRAQSTCGHDHLGSPAFLEKLEGQPDLLLPHLHKLSLEASAA